MCRVLAKILCLVDCCPSATPVIDLELAQTTIFGDIVGTKDRDCLALLSGTHTVLFKYV